MATVPELKTQAETLGIKVPSKWRKAEIEQAIAEQTTKNAETRKATVRKVVAKRAESDSKPAADPTPTDTRTQRREAARLAGSRAKVTAPMINLRRVINYRWQNAPRIKGETVLSEKALTARQSRRKLKKANRKLGFNGCTLATYREMRRKLKKAGIYAS